MIFNPSPVVIYSGRRYLCRDLRSAFIFVSWIKFARPRVNILYEFANIVYNDNRVNLQSSRNEITEL